MWNGEILALFNIAEKNCCEMRNLKTSLGKPVAYFSNAVLNGVKSLCWLPRYKLPARIVSKLINFDYGKRVPLA